MNAPIVIHEQVLGDVRELILQARVTVRAAVNAELTTLYWSIGKRIQSEIGRSALLNSGEDLVHGLAESLSVEYGRGFGNKNLLHMVRFYLSFQDDAIVYALRRQLSWTHFRCLI